MTRRFISSGLLLPPPPPAAASALLLLLPPPRGEISTTLVRYIGRFNLDKQTLLPPPPPPPLCIGSKILRDGYIREETAAPVDHLLQLRLLSEGRPPQERDFNPLLPACANRDRPRKCAFREGNGRNIRRVEHRRVIGRGQLRVRFVTAITRYRVIPRKGRALLIDFHHCFKCRSNLTKGNLCLFTLILGLQPKTHRVAIRWDGRRSVALDNVALACYHLIYNEFR